MNTLSITLYGLIPSKKNSKQWIFRGGRRYLVPSNNHKAWHTEQMLELWKMNKKAKLPHITEKAFFTLTFFAGDKRRADLTNKAESVMDLLKDYGVIEDDNWFVCGSVRLEFGGVDKGKPRVCIDIEYTETPETD